MHGLRAPCPAESAFPENTQGNRIWVITGMTEGRRQYLCGPCSAFCGKLSTRRTRRTTERHRAFPLVAACFGTVFNDNVTHREIPSVLFRGSSCTPC
jgi:hypothetical protein